VQALERAGRLVPDDPVILEHLGDVYQKIGVYEKALKAYKRALERAPEEDKAKINTKIGEIKSRMSIR
jgi:tetratricopeptide (TPR) repeat protein